MAMKRFRVSEDSMRPTLEPGQEIVAIDNRTPEVGDIVVFPHPSRDDFWMVKRRAVPPEAIDQSHAWVMSDNTPAILADSRTLGPIPIETMMTVVDRFDADTFVDACSLLADEDDALGKALTQYGVPDFWNRQPGLPTLVLLILEQQVSLESGAAMYQTLDKATDGITAETLIDLGAEGMRAIGVTRQKSDYLANLGTQVTTGKLDIEGLDRLGVDDARQSLVALKGIGPWTADAYLLSALRHVDMFPVGDRALQVGAADVLGMTGPPSEKELGLLGEPWRPVRAAAARIIWHAYLKSRGRVEPPDPTLARGAPTSAYADQQHDRVHRPDEKRARAAGRPYGGPRSFRSQCRGTDGV